MNSLILLFGLSLSLLNPACAQRAARARSLLDRVYKTYRKQRDVNMKFEYELYNERANLRQKSSGTLLVKGRKYALDFMGVEHRFDGKKHYTILPEDKEVNISSAADDDHALTPDKLLKSYRKGYALSWDVRQQVAGETVQFIKLRPKHKSDIRYILIGIKVKSHTLYKVINTDQKGGITTLTVTAYKTNQGFSDERFGFDAQQYTDYLINHLE